MNYKINQSKGKKAINTLIKLTRLKEINKEVEDQLIKERLDEIRTKYKKYKKGLSKKQQKEISLKNKHKRIKEEILRSVFK